MTDRTSSDEPYFATRIREADLVVLSDGSPLHAKSVWHASLVGEAIRDAMCVVAIGSVASVLGDVMIDPRGGAPTTGLGYRDGPVLSVGASEEQLHRTRTLLGVDRSFSGARSSRRCLWRRNNRGARSVTTSSLLASMTSPRSRPR